MTRLLTLLATLAAGATGLLWMLHPPLPSGGEPAAGPLSDRPLNRQGDTRREPFSLRARDRDLNIKPLAHYEVRGVVLSETHYWIDDSAPLSPVDLCIAWGGIAEPKIFRQLSVSQSYRWCSWTYRESFPYDNGFINRNMANTHIIPATGTLAAAAGRVRGGDWVEIEGELVVISGRLKGREFTWRSSLSRDDEGGGACEVLYLTRLQFRGEEWRE
jgi:hypothetical protein